MWPSAADRGHHAAHRAAQQRRAAAGQRAVVRERFGKAHRDAGADGGRHADQKGLPGAVRGEGCREQRRKRRYRAIHEPGEARLHVLQHEHAPRGFIFLGARARRENCLAELVRQALVACFSLRQLDQQLAHRGVACVFCRLAVEALRLELHVLGELAHLLEAERPHQPQRLLRLQEALDVLPADQRQVVSEFLAIEIEQHRAVMHFLFGHLVEYLCGGRELLAQTFGKTAIDAAILFLVGDGEGQNFLLAEIGKSFHALPRCRPRNVLWHMLESF